MSDKKWLFDRIFFFYFAFSIIIFFTRCHVGLSAPLDASINASISPESSINVTSIHPNCVENRCPIKITINGQGLTPDSEVYLSLGGSDIIGHYDISNYAKDVAMRGNCAYIANRRGGLQIVDISDPVHPHQIGSYTTLNSII